MKILKKIIKYLSMLVAKVCTTAQNVPTFGYGLVFILSSGYRPTTLKTDLS